MQEPAEDGRGLPESGRDRDVLFHHERRRDDQAKGNGYPENDQ